MGGPARRPGQGQGVGRQALSQMTESRLLGRDEREAKRGGGATQPCAQQHRGAAPRAPSATASSRNETFRACLFWSGEKRDRWGALKPAICRKARQLLRGRRLPPVPLHAHSCRFFEANPSPSEAMK
jgi:hypothetical protein